MATRKANNGPPWLHFRKTKASKFQQLPNFEIPSTNFCGLKVTFESWGNDNGLETSAMDLFTGCWWWSKCVRTWIQKQSRKRLKTLKYIMAIQIRVHTSKQKRDLMRPSGRFRRLCSGLWWKGGEMMSLTFTDLRCLTKSYPRTEWPNNSWLHPILELGDETLLCFDQWSLQIHTKM